MAAFKQEYIDALREDEQQMADTILQQSRHLSQFLSRKSLAQWHKIELIEWIQENVTQLAASPFCDRDQLAEITRFLEDLHRSLGLILPEPEFGPDSSESGPEQTQKQRQKNQRADSATTDMFEDLFTLFNLHQEHTGEFPLESLSGDSDQVLDLLKAHTQYCHPEALPGGTFRYDSANRFFLMAGEKRTECVHVFSWSVFATEEHGRKNRKDFPDYSRHDLSRHAPVVEHLYLGGELLKLLLKCHL